MKFVIEIKGMIFRCRNCNGSGKVKNDLFEKCMKLSPEEASHHDITHGKCKKCLFKVGCDNGEEIDCPCCDGNGELIIRDEFWEYDRCLVNTQSDAQCAEEEASRSSVEVSLLNNQ